MTKKEYKKRLAAIPNTGEVCDLLDEMLADFDSAYDSDSQKSEPIELDQPSFYRGYKVGRADGLNWAYRAFSGLLGDKDYPWEGKK